MEVDGRIVISEIEGPWNLELVEAWAIPAARLYAKLGASGRCGGIGVHTKSLLTSPQSIRRLRELTALAVANHNIAACAVVGAAGVEGYQLAPTFMARIYEGIVPFEMFDSVERAKVWVNHAIAN